MSSEEPTLSRRKVLLTSAPIGALALAGCLGGDDDDDEAGSGDDDAGDDYDDDHDDDNGDDHDHDDDHDDVADEEFDELGIEEFTVLDRAHDPHEEVAYVHGDHWHGSLPEIPHGDNVSLGADIEDEDGDTFELDGEFELRVALAPDEPDDVVSFDYHGDHVHIIGEQEGVVDIVFQIYHDDHADYQSAPITAQVVDDDHGHDDEGEDEAFDDLGIDEFTVLDRAHDPHEEAAYIHGDHWHGDLPQIEAGDNVSLGADITDDDGDTFELDDEYELRAALAPDEPDDIVLFDYHGDHIHLIGEEEGVVDVVFQIYHDDHADYQTPPIAAQVVNDVDDDHGHDDDY